MRYLFIIDLHGNRLPDFYAPNVFLKIDRFPLSRLRNLDVSTALVVKVAEDAFRGTIVDDTTTFSFPASITGTRLRNILVNRRASIFFVNGEVLGL
jgi:hypothetical protein